MYKCYPVKGFQTTIPSLRGIKGEDYETCKELKLIIEVDGITHTLEDVIRKDKIRQEKLERAGFTVIRFTDEEVLKHIRNVQRAIEACVEELERNIHPLNPPPAGDSEV